MSCRGRNQAAAIPAAIILAKSVQVMALPIMHPIWRSDTGMLENHLGVKPCRRSNSAVVKGLARVKTRMT